MGIGERCWWRSWLTHCATRLKVAVSIPCDVIGIYHWHHPSGRTMALELTQHLTEMSTTNISRGVKVVCAYGWQPYHLHMSTAWNLVASTSWNPQGLFRPVQELLYLYLFTFTSTFTFTFLPLPLPLPLPLRKNKKIKFAIYVWPVPVSRIQKSLQRSIMIPSASRTVVFHYPG